MGIVESAQMAQDWYLHQEEMNWAKKAYALDKLSLNTDLVNTIREDLRDLCSQRYGRIDNLLVVNTLVLSFSFGFCCEGTFPDTDYFSEEKFWITFYSVFLGLTLIFPFWSIWYALECKTCLDQFLHGVLNERKKRGMVDVRTWLQHYIGFEQHWMNQCQRRYRISQNFFWAGMLCSITLCAILTGMNFSKWYHPGVWIVFVSIIMINVLLITLILAYRGIRHCQKTLDKHSVAKQDVDVADLETSMVQAMEKSSAKFIMQQGNLQTSPSNIFDEREDEIVASPVIQ